MYDLYMQNSELGFIENRLAAAIELRRTTPAQLARDAGVDKSTISLILAGKRQNTPAIIIARLATVLEVSIDYLLGLSEEPAPRQLDLSDLAIELMRVARQLTDRRQRSLLLLARQYLEESGWSCVTKVTCTTYQWSGGHLHHVH